MFKKDYNSVFKNSVPEEERIREYKYIKSKYPDHIPLILEKHQRTQNGENQFKWKKFFKTRFYFRSS